MKLLHQLICYHLPHDAAIWSEFESLFFELQRKDWDEQACDDIATEWIEQKYPASRGFMRISDLLADLID